MSERDACKRNGNVIDKIMLMREVVYPDRVKKNMKKFYDLVKILSGSFLGFMQRSASVYYQTYLFSIRRRNKGESFRFFSIGRESILLSQFLTFEVKFLWICQQNSLENTIVLL